MHPFQIKSLSPQLIVANLEDSIAFYTEKLHFSVQFRYEDFYAGLFKDGHSIHLKQGSPDAGERSYKRDQGHVDILFSVNEIESIYAAVQRAAVSIVQPITKRPYGTEFYMADPDGYILAFVEEA